MKLKTVLLGASVFFIFWILTPILMVYLNGRFSLPAYRFGIMGYIGILFLFFDISVFLYCNNLFQRFGKGTFMPTESTRKFVEKGLYRFVRNPIYVGHIAGIFGIFLLTGRLMLFIYAAAFFIFIHFMVLLFEEPDLRKKFGKSYIGYTKRVKRWGLF
jgi:protein-S-isoprenylcysteine O-methyltransferase Ste14